MSLPLRREVQALLHLGRRHRPPQGTPGGAPPSPQPAWHVKVGGAPTRGRHCQQVTLGPPREGCGSVHGQFVTNRRRPRVPFGIDSKSLRRRSPVRRRPGPGSGSRPGSSIARRAASALHAGTPAGRGVLSWAAKGPTGAAAPSARHPTPHGLFSDGHGLRSRDNVRDNWGSHCVWGARRAPDTPLLPKLSLCIFVAFSPITRETCF